MILLLYRIYGSMRSGKGVSVDRKGMMNSLQFYEQLPIHDSLEAVIRGSAFQNVPEDWWLLITDIKGSTEVIDTGGYRDVVTLGTATIIAALNAVDGADVPFRYGGDGSVICIPDSYIEQVLSNLSALQRDSRDRFGIDIRCGAVRVGDLQRDGFDVMVGRYRLSKHIVLAVFSGGGIDQAELIVKGRARGAYRVPERTPSQLKLDGLECRWKPLHSRKGKFLSLIVVPLGSTREQRTAHLEEVFSLLGSIYGAEQTVRPVDVSELELGISKEYLQGETRLRMKKNTWFHRIRYLYLLKLTVLLGSFLMAKKVKAGGVNWGQYKGDFVQNIDNRSFADIYSHVFPGSDSQHQRLESELNERWEQGKITFGIHVSDHALFTCHITQYTGKHLHFLDGGAGGLTLAAKNMKKKKGVTREVDSPISLVTD